MHRRLPLVFLPLLYAPLCFANDAAWNCEQNKDTKEWLCVGDEKPSTPSEPVSSVPSSRPAQVERDDELSSPTPKTARTPEPAIKSEEEPVLAKPEPRTPEPEPAPVDKTEPESEPVQAKPAAIPELADEPVKVTKTEDAPVLDKSTEKVAAKSSEEEDENTEETEDEEDQEKPKKLTSASKTTRMSGWNCNSKNQTDDWSCHLVGSDPKGQARPVRVVREDKSWHLLDPAFDADQEQTFETMAGRFNYDPWDENLTEEQRKKATTSKKSERETAPIELTSDFAEIFDNEIGSYLGNVEISRADQRSLSHIANYDKVSGVLDLNGDVYYDEEELALYGRSASIKLNSDQAKLRNALFVSPATHLRGSSKVVYRDSKTFSRYKEVSYTSCRPGNQDWVLHADELKLNDVTGKGAVKDAWLEFKGLPVFYTPYLSFPKDDRRITGFLPPSLHYTQQAGFGIYTPFYWNIDPNYDFTFIPRYLTDRGILLGGDFRYLEKMTRGDVKFEYMPNDYKLSKSRYLGALRNNTVFTPHLTSNLDLNYVSDKNYFNQLGNALSLPNFSYLRSSADLNYGREGVSFTLRADNYQRVDPLLLTLPYRRLPQVNLNLNHSFKTVVPIDVAMENESIYFQHGEMVNGERINIKPYVSMPFETASGFIRPKVSLQHTQYFLSNNNATALTDTDISRTLPILSLDSGAFFEKELSLGDAPMTHTIEPRLFYLYIPYTKQSNIPLFDTAQYDFVFDSLFRENQFSGNDRVQDANQLSAAITSRLIDSATGREKLKFSVGDIFYFRDRKVTLHSGIPTETSWSSPIVAELNSALTDHISVETGMQWDPHISDFTRGKAVFHYVNQPGEMFNAGYYYRKNPQIPDRSDDIIQSDVSFHWPIYDGWSAVGRWQYSLLYDRTQEGFLGVEKENCCWRFRLIGRRYINGFTNTTGLVSAGTNQAIAEGPSQTGVFFQIELKGLTGLGERLDEFFERNIYGYRKPKK